MRANGILLTVGFLSLLATGILPHATQRATGQVRQSAARQDARNSADDGQVNLCVGPWCGDQDGGRWVQGMIPSEATNLSLDVLDNGTYSVSGSRNGQPVELSGTVTWLNGTPVFQPALPPLLAGETEPAYRVIAAFAPSVAGMDAADPGSVTSFNIDMEFTGGPQQAGEPLLGIGYSILPTRRPAGAIGDPTAKIQLPSGRTSDVSLRFYDKTGAPIELEGAKRLLQAEMKRLESTLRNFSRTALVREFPDPQSPDTRLHVADQLRATSKLTPAQAWDWMLGKMSAAEFRNTVGELFAEPEVTVSVTAEVEVSIPGFGSVKVTAEVSVTGPASEVAELVDIASQAAASAAQKAAEQMRDRIEDMMKVFREWVENTRNWLWRWFLN